MSWIAAGVAAVTTGAKLYQGHHEADRQRNLLYQAYDRGKARLDVNQTDVRQNTGEGLIARGLAGGGGVATGGPVSPGEDLGVGGTAHTLGQQQTTDLHREQGLEQNDLLQQRNTGIDNVGAAATQNAIDAVGSGISSAFGLHGAMQEAGAGTSSATPSGTALPASSTNIASAPTSVRGAYGLDVLHPEISAVGSSMGVGQANYGFRRPS